MTTSTRIRMLLVIFFFFFFNHNENVFKIILMMGRNRNRRRKRRNFGETRIRNDWWIGLDGLWEFGAIDGGYGYGRSTMSNRIALLPYRAAVKIQFGTRCRSIASLFRIASAVRNTDPCCLAARRGSRCACSGMPVETPSDNHPSNSLHRICNTKWCFLLFLLFT